MLKESNCSISITEVYKLWNITPLFIHSTGQSVVIIYEHQRRYSSMCFLLIVIPTTRLQRSFQQQLQSDIDGSKQCLVSCCDVATWAIKKLRLPTISELSHCKTLGYVSAIQPLWHFRGRLVYCSAWRINQIEGFARCFLSSCKGVANDLPVEIVFLEIESQSNLQMPMNCNEINSWQQQGVL